MKKTAVLLIAAALLIFSAVPITAEDAPTGSVGTVLTITTPSFFRYLIFLTASPGSNASKRSALPWGISGE